MHHITLPSGGTIAYRTEGTGFPLLLLHGWGGSSRYWKQMLHQLSDIRTIYAPDLPGYGESPPFVKIASPERMARLMIDLLDALELEQVDVNGHSFSANVAVNMAVRWPSRIRNVTLTCPSTYRNERERHFVGLIHRMTALWMALRRPWMIDEPRIYRFAARPFFYRMPDDNDLLRENFADFLNMNQPIALESAVMAVSPNYNEMLQQVAQPSLVIGARHDNVMPRYGPPLVAKLLPNSTMAWIEESGHLPMVEQADQYEATLRDFLLKGGNNVDDTA